MTAQVTGFTTYPQRTQPATFAADMDTHIQELGSFINELNTVTNEVNDNTMAAANSATAAEVYALALEGAAAAVKWVSGSTYAQGVKVWSPTDFQDYRARIALTNNTTDPYNDSANWARVSQKENADTVDNFHASQTPAANEVVVVKADGTTALPKGVSVGNTEVADATTLDWYEEGNYTGTATGLTTAPTGTISFIRIGKQVTLQIPANFTGTSNATTFSITGMPTNIRPTATRYILLRIVDSGNSAVVMANATVGINGTITMYKDLAAGVFTASGTKSLSPQDGVTYTI